MELVYHIVNRGIRGNFGGVMLSPHLYDEYVGEGMLALTNAERAFDPKAGYNFSTFACRCIINALILFNKSFYSKKAAQATKFCSHETMDRVMHINPDNIFDPTKTLGDQFPCNVHELMDDLCESELNLMTALLEGESQTRYAKKMGYTRSRAGKIFKQAITKMRKAAQLRFPGEFV